MGGTISEYYESNGREADEFFQIGLNDANLEQLRAYYQRNSRVNFETT